MKVVISDKAKKDIRKLDVKIQKQILTYTLSLESLPDPRVRGKPLSSTMAGLWRYRVGDYRLICEIRDDKLIVTVLRIGHRRNVYKTKNQ